MCVCVSCFIYHQRCSPLWVLQEQLDILDKLFLTERWKSKKSNLVFLFILDSYRVDGRARFYEE